MTRHEEPNVVVNGVELNTAQSMALRVAVGSMLQELADKDYMVLIGEIGPLYQARLREIERIMLMSTPQC